MNEGGIINGILNRWEAVKQPLALLNHYKVGIMITFIKI